MDYNNPTLDIYGGWSTPGIGDSTVNNQSGDWSAAASQPGASSWSDVLKLGFSRLVDAKVRPVQSENAAPVLQKTQPASASSPANVKGEGADNKMLFAVLGTLGAAGLLLLLVKSARA